MKLLARALGLSLPALALCAPLASAAQPQEVTLELLGRTPAPGAPNQAEIAAFDPASERVFATSADGNALRSSTSPIPPARRRLRASISRLSAAAPTPSR